MRRMSVVGVAGCIVVACGGAAEVEEGTGTSESPSSVTAAVAAAAPTGSFDGGIVLPPLADGEFVIRMSGNRCVDVGASSTWASRPPVTIRACSGGASQRIRVRELPFSSHDIQLMIASSGYCIASAKPATVADPRGHRLQVMPCDAASAGQRFAYDGDAILMGDQTGSARVSRSAVVGLAGKDTREGTNLVVKDREVDDAEYFSMTATDGTGRKPTKGFAVAATEAELRAGLAGGWGTVVEVGPVNMPLWGNTIDVPAGVTIRGSRRERRSGATLHLQPDAAVTDFAFRLRDRARITGVSLRGPEGGRDGIHGVHVLVDPGTTVRSLVDNVDAYHWTGGFVYAAGQTGPYNAANCDATPKPATCVCNPTASLAVPEVVVARSVIHHNDPSDIGYGVMAQSGGYYEARGNVLFMNAHSLTSSGQINNRYDAFANLVQSDSSNLEKTNQVFDIHGTFPDGEWKTGAAGERFRFWNNTFLTSRIHVRVRGLPCGMVSLRNNTSTRERDPSWVPPPFNHDPSFLFDNTSTTREDVGNVFEAPNPTQALRVADFDGDGVDDLFMATGTTFWMSSGGLTEWRYLNTANDAAANLRFGDLDGDGRADILAKHGTSIDVSWGGISPWTHILTSSNLGIEDIAVGNFDGDNRADIFFSNGSTWQYAPGGQLPLVHLATSSARGAALRFGDFGGDTRTDVLSIVNGNYAVVNTGVSASWEILRPSLTGSSLASVAIGDFDGDGKDDVAGQDTLSPSEVTWWYAARAKGNKTVLRIISNDHAIWRVPVGRFRPGKDEALVYTSSALSVASGSAALERYSRMAMK